MAALVMCNRLVVLGLTRQVSGVVSNRRLLVQVRCETACHVKMSRGILTRGSSRVSDDLSNLRLLTVVFTALANVGHRALAVRSLLPVPPVPLLSGLKV